MLIELLLSIYVSTLHSSFTPFVNPFCLSIANGDIDWLLGGCWDVGTLRFSLDLQFFKYLPNRESHIHFTRRCKRVSPETCRTRISRDQSRTGTAVSRAESFPQFTIVPGDSWVAAYTACQSQITRLLRCRQLRLRAAAMSIAGVQLLLTGSEMRFLQRLVATVR